MRYYITIDYNKDLHLSLLTRSQIPCAGRKNTLSFIFNEINDNDSELIIKNLYNGTV
jgi:hypothetical protein